MFSDLLRLKELGRSETAQDSGLTFVCFGDDIAVIEIRLSLEHVQANRSELFEAGGGGHGMLSAP